MFVRKKSILNKKTGTRYEYAYAVCNKWRKKQARQRVRAYLGKVLKFELVDECEFLEFADSGVLDSNPRTIIKKLIEWEFKKHRIPDSVSVKYSRCQVLENEKPVSIEINDGMLNSYTLRNLLFFKPRNDEEQPGYGLARGFVEAGIAIPQEVFVALYGKVYS